MGASMLLTQINTYTHTHTLDPPVNRLFFCNFRVLDACYFLGSFVPVLPVYSKKRFGRGTRVSDWSNHRHFTTSNGMCLFCSEKRVPNKYERTVIILLFIQPYASTRPYSIEKLFRIWWLPWFCSKFADLTLCPTLNTFRTRWTSCLSVSENKKLYLFQCGVLILFFGNTVVVCRSHKPHHTEKQIDTFYTVRCAFSFKVNWTPWGFHIDMRCPHKRQTVTPSMPTHCVRLCFPLGILHDERVFAAKASLEKYFHVTVTHANAANHIVVRHNNCR